MMKPLILIVASITVLTSFSLFAAESIQKTAAVTFSLESHPDILSLTPDLENPPITLGKPAPGKTVMQSIPSYEGTEVKHSLYLPTDWKAGGSYPVIVEYLGNSARVRDNKGIGYAISGGKEFIRVVLPFVSTDHKQDLDWWWGDTEATVAYAKIAIPEICKKWGGDPQRVILTGYSRGAIACNYIGLHDDEIAKLWRGIAPLSHYDDGHISWGMTPEEQRRAPERLRRLGSIPQWIGGEYCTVPQMESDKLLLKRIQEEKIMRFSEAKKKLYLKPIVEVEGTRKFIELIYPQGNYTWANFPWVNHTSKVLFRETPIRQQLRQWIQEILKTPLSSQKNELGIKKP